jgi:leucyl aminopeptidase
MNGKTVEVDNTDAEGRLVLSGLFFTAVIFIPSSQWG